MICALASPALGLFSLPGRWMIVGNVPNFAAIACLYFCYRPLNSVPPNIALGYDDSSTDRELSTYWAAEQDPVQWGRCLNSRHLEHIFDKREEKFENHRSLAYDEITSEMYHIGSILTNRRRIVLWRQRYVTISCLHDYFNSFSCVTFNLWQWVCALTIIMYQHVADWKDSHPIHLTRMCNVLGYWTFHWPWLM